MTDTSLDYIETPRSTERPTLLSDVLEKRMKEFLLARQQKLWREGRL